MSKMVRVGYHRVSDDSVNSAYLTRDEANVRIAECKADGDVDHIWTRDAADVVDWEWHRVPRFGIAFGGREVEFAYDRRDDSIHNTVNGETLGSTNGLGDVRWTDLTTARAWAEANMSYVMALVPSTVLMDTTVTDGEVFIKTNNDMTAEMPCPTCYTGEFSLDPNDYPMRKVTGTFVTKGSDPTTAYNLECGHSTIDL